MNCAATILVVEDEPDILKLIRTALSKVPTYTVLCARSGEEGLKISLASRRTIHLLVSNVFLPGMLGSTMAAKIKAQRPRMRVILVDGKGRGKLALLGLNAGWEVLRKPQTGAALLERVRAELVRGQRD